MNLDQIGADVILSWCQPGTNLAPTDTNLLPSWYPLFVNRWQQLSTHLVPHWHQLLVDNQCRLQPCTHLMPSQYQVGTDLTRYHLATNFGPSCTNLVPSLYEVFSNFLSSQHQIKFDRGQLQLGTNLVPSWIQLDSNLGVKFYCSMSFYEATSRRGCHNKAFEMCKLQA